MFTTDILQWKAEIQGLSGCLLILQTCRRVINHMHSGIIAISRGSRFSWCNTRAWCLLLDRPFSRTTTLACGYDLTAGWSHNSIWKHLQTVCSQSLEGPFVSRFLTNSWCLCDITANVMIYIARWCVCIHVGLYVCIIWNDLNSINSFSKSNFLLLNWLLQVVISTVFSYWW